jgi:hypothetical protein
MNKTKCIIGAIIIISTLSFMGCTVTPVTKTISITETQTITSESMDELIVPTTTNQNQKVYYQCLRCAYIEEVPADAIVEKLPTRKWCPACQCGSCGVMYLFTN